MEGPQLTNAGILGREIVIELGRDPDQWSRVHALSRSKKEACASNVVHNFIDLQASAEDMVRSLKDVEGEYVFFAAYLQKESEQENWDVNGVIDHQMLPTSEELATLTRFR